MFNVFKYCLFDLIRSRWTIIYTLFYLLTATSLLYFSNSPANAVVSLMNVVLFITPLVSILLGIIYFYQNRDFAELLLSQPIKRSQFFLGNYLGLSVSLILSLLIGIGLPTFFINTGGDALLNLITLMISGILLTLIFGGFALLLTLLNENRVKGFGFAILLWLVFSIIYDGLFLIALLWFSDYPLETFTLIATVLNPIDLSRVMILLKLDLSALLGFTGATFQSFFGNNVGILISLFSALIWIIIPLFLIIKTGNKRDF